MSAAKNSQASFPEESELFSASRVARIEILSNLNVSQLARLCGTGKRAALVICGQGTERIVDSKGSAPLYALGNGDGTLVISDLEVLPEVWETLLQRDFGVSRTSRSCTAFTLFERRLVAASMQRYENGAKTNLERLRRWRALYRELYLLAVDLNPAATGGPSTSPTQFKVAFMADGIAIQLEQPGAKLLLSSVVDLIAAKLAGNPYDRSHSIVLSDNQGVGLLGSGIDTPQMHTGAYIFSNGVNGTSALFVCRSDDFWRVSLPYSSVWKIYIDPREPSLVYSLDYRSNSVFVVDLEGEKAEAYRLDVPAERTASFSTGYKAYVATKKLVIGVDKAGGFRVSSPKSDQSFTVPGIPSSSFNLNRAETIQIYLVPVVKSTWSDKQNERFTLTVLCLAQVSVVTANIRSTLFVFQLNSEQKIVAPPLVYPVLYDARVTGIWRAGPTTVLLTRPVTDELNYSFEIDWRTGFYAVFKKPIWLSRLRSAFGEWQRIYPGWLPPPAGDLWAYDPMFNSKNMYILRQPAKLAKVLNK